MADTKKFGTTVETVTQKITDFVPGVISPDQTAKAIFDATEVIRQINLAETEQQATEVAAAARGYVTALCDQKLIEHAIWRQLTTEIDVVRGDWQCPLRGQDGDSQ